jgi:GNAT superfamily N-acetyltransferase
MSLEVALDGYVRDLPLKNGQSCRVRPIEAGDAQALHRFFLAMPAPELMFIKHRVTELEVIRQWCHSIDYGRNLPLLAFSGDAVIGIATLHQQHSGWKRHVGRVSVHVHPAHRGVGLARLLITELIEIGRQGGLEKIEAEFIAKQENAIRMFSLLGFSQLYRLTDYVKDMQAVTHDYILMGMDLITDEEYAGMG